MAVQDQLQCPCCMTTFGWPRGPEFPPQCPHCSANQPDRETAIVEKQLLAGATKGGFAIGGFSTV